VGPAEKAYYQNIAQLVQAILRKDSAGKYDRIGVFRRPIQSGTLDKMEMIQAGRTQILNFISTKLTFVGKASTDFGYPISANTKVSALTFLQVLNTNFGEDAAQVVHEVLQALTVKMLSSKDWVENRLDLFRRLEISTRLANDLKKPLSPAKYVETYLNGLREADFVIPANNSKNLERYGQYVEFLEQVLEKPALVNPNHALDTLKEELDKLVRWYDFLIYLGKQFSTYDYQMDPSAYNVQNLDHWGQTKKPQGISITNANWAKFLTLIKYDGKPLLTKLPDGMLGELRTALAQLLQYPPPVVTDNGSGVTTIKSHFLSLKRINEVLDAGRLEATKTHTVLIFGSRKIFVDMTLQLPGEATPHNIFKFC